MIEEYLITNLNKKQRVFTYSKGDPSHETLVFLHGLGATHTGYHDLIDKLAEKYFVYAPHIPGFGYSTAPSKFEMQDYVENLWQVLLTYKTKHQITIMGHSFGGAMATKLVEKDQSMFGRLILINSAGIPPQDTAGYLDWIVRSMNVSRKFIEEIKSDKGMVKKIFQELLFSTFRLKDTYNTADMITRLDMREDFSQIRVPTSLLWSQEDNYFPLETAHQMHDLIPGSSFKIVESKKGHSWCMVEPDQVLNNI